MGVPGIAEAIVGVEDFCGDWRNGTVCSRVAGFPSIIAGIELDGTDLHLYNIP
jgi:hypothetical protein